MFALGAPALVMNLGFWNPYMDAHQESLQTNSAKCPIKERRDLWRLEIDRFLCGLLNRLVGSRWAGTWIPLRQRRRGTKSRTERKRRLYDAFAGALEFTEPGYGQLGKFEIAALEPTPAKYDVIMFEFKHSDSAFRLHLMAECHHEYWTLVIGISLDSHPCAEKPNATFRPAFGSDEATAQFFEDLHTVWSGIDLDKIGSDPDKFWSDPPSNARSTERIVSRAELAYDVCVVRFDKLASALIGRYDESKIGHPHARFVGNLFWMPRYSNGTSLESAHRTEIEQKLTASGWSPRNFEPASFPADASAIAAVWPLVKRMQGRRSRTRSIDDRDIVASYFLNRRAIYTSSLARNERTGKDRPPRVVFSMFLAMEDRWQIGRLVDRLFCCGNARLATMRGFDLVLEAGETLHQIEDELLEAGTNFDQAVRDKVEDLFWRIDANFIEYRIERAQHYWSQFHNLLAGLRERRIEGFQPYGQFVRRRLGGSVNLIDSIGRRQQRVRAEVDLRHQVQQTATFVDLQQQLVSLQHVGEVFATISIGYYISSWISGFTKKTTLEVCLPRNLLYGSTSPEYGSYCWEGSPYELGAWIAITAFLAYRTYHFLHSFVKKYKRKRKRRMFKSTDTRRQQASHYGRSTS
jgi:hypothetical protein